MAILVTGGAGYIGSHTCIELLGTGFWPVVVDNLSNSGREVLNRVEMISGQKVLFDDFDIGDQEGLRKVFSECEIEAVIHFAGMKVVGGSVEQLLRYCQNNVAGTQALIDVMEEFDVFRMIFSSSTTVYEEPDTVPIKEDFKIGATNPYGASKLVKEGILRNICVVPGSYWKVSLLRYFNPIGAHKSERIGEDPRGIPNNLLPYVSQVAVGRGPYLLVFGDDYETVDGTGVRDYILI